MYFDPQLLFTGNACGSQKVATQMLSAFLDNNSEGSKLCKYENNLVL